MNDLQAFGLIAEIVSGRPDAADHARLHRRIESAAGDWPRILTLASEHCATPALAAAIRRANLLSGTDEDLARYFDAVLDLNRKRNRLLYAQVQTVLDVLNRCGIEPIVLKGTAYLLLGLFEDVGERLVGDIDLLVPDGRSGEAVEELLGAGYRVTGDAESDHHHHHPALGHAAWPAAVEVHRQVVSHLYARALPAEPLARRARQLVVDGRRVRVPCPEDLIVHNIVHGQLVDRDFWSAELSLRDAYDLIALTRRFRDDLDWVALSARLARDVGSSKAGFYVRRAFRLFGEEPPAPLPRPLGARLVDARWALHAAGRLSWLQRATRRLAYQAQVCARFLASAAERRRLVRRLLMPH